MLKSLSLVAVLATSLFGHAAQAVPLQRCDPNTPGSYTQGCTERLDKRGKKKAVTTPKPDKPVAKILADRDIGGQEGGGGGGGRGR
jgi:hypothetical protein